MVQVEQVQIALGYRMSSTKQATGRTTFVNTLCGERVLSQKDADDAANAHLEEGVRIKPVTVGRSALLQLSKSMH